MTTFADLKTRCATRFRDSSNEIVSATEWGEYLNEAYRDVQQSHPEWPWMDQQTTSLTISASTRSAALPADVFRTSVVYNSTDDLLMMPIDGGHRQAFKLYPEQTETGTPEQYVIEGTYLFIYPMATVTTTFEVHYYGPRADMTGTDEPAFPEQYHRILIDGAMARAYEDDGNGGQAQVAWEHFAAGIDRMKTDLLNAHYDRYQQIIDDWWDGRD